jgi:hypothetical protein
MKIKKCLTGSLIIMLSASYSVTSFAALVEEQGFTGEIAIMTGYTQSTSNLNTDGEKLKTGKLNQAGSSEESFLIMPLANLQYTFGHDLNKQIFFGTSQDDVAVGDLAFQLGYSQAFDSGMVMSFAYLPSVLSSETWEDPYLLNDDKKITDVSGNALRFQITSIAGSNFSLDLGYGTTEVDNEQSGSNFSLPDQALLNRNADIVYVKSTYQYSIEQTSMLIPSLTYISHSADGTAMSFDSYGGDLTYFTTINNYQIAVTATYSYSAYDAANPVFNKTREDNAYSLFVSYEQELGQELDDWSFISFIGYSKSLSNIDFYDENNLLVSFGGKYNF